MSVKGNICYLLTLGSLLTTTTREVGRIRAEVAHRFLTARRELSHGTLGNESVAGIELRGN